MKKCIKILCIGISYLRYLLNKLHDTPRIFFEKTFKYSDLLAKLNFEKTTHLAIVATTPNDSVKFSIRYLLKALIHNGYTIIFPLIPADQRDWILKEFPNINIVERPRKGRDIAVWKYILMALFSNQILRKNIQSLILINDSLYFSKKTENIITQLKSTNKKWSCMFETFEYHYHAQSFCLQFGNEVINSSTFLKFWEEYKPYDHKRHAVFYGEVKLSKTLIKEFDFPDVIFNYDTFAKDIINLSNNDIYKLIKIILNIDPNLQHSSLKKTYNQIQHLANLLEKQTQVNDIQYTLGSICSALFAKTNLTHSMALILNILYGAPIKKDLTLLGHYDFLYVVSNAQHYTNDDLDEMKIDLKIKQINYNDTISIKGGLLLIFRQIMNNW